MLKISGKRILNREVSQKTDQQVLKTIVDPFLEWYKSEFDKCLEDIKTFPDRESIEESFNDDRGFEVNEETLYNILSAELQGGSKVQSIHTYRTLPSIPQCIANATDLQQKTYNYKLNHHVHKKLGVKFDNNAGITEKKNSSVPKDFIETKDLFKKMQHLRIVEQYMKFTDKENA